MTTVDISAVCKAPPGSPSSIEVISQYVDVKLTYTYTGRKAAELTTLLTSKDAEQCFRTVFDPGRIALQECLYFIALNKANRLIAISCLSTGSTVGTVCDIKLMLIHLIALNCQTVILCHNHPSGNLNPSTADREFTIKFRSACNLLDIRLMDHVILSPDEGQFYSFADNGDI